jgi:hypothetical protein
MADLTMSLGYQEQNDNKAIVLTDTTVNYNTTILPNLVDGDTPIENALYEIVSQNATDFAANYGAYDNLPGTRFVWDDTPIELSVGDELKTVTPRVTEILSLTLDTTITGVSNVAVPADQVDLIAEFGAAVIPYFTDQSQLVYTITSDMLGTGTDALLEDGLYALEYKVGYKGQAADGTNFSDTEKIETFEVTVLVYGQVKVAVYDKYRQIPAWCNCEDQDALWKIMETDLLGAYLTAIETSAYIAKTEELINMLIVLDDMVKNGSKLYY